MPPDGRATDYFGQSVDIDGDRIIVGAYGDSHSDSKSGSAYVYKVAKKGWDLRAKLVARKARKLHEFGRSVAIGGKRVVVGMHGDSIKGPWAGAAFVY